MQDFARLSAYASLASMLLAAVVFLACSYGALLLAGYVRRVTGMVALAGLVAVLWLFMSYFAYTAAYIWFDSRLEFHLTGVFQLCHLPGLLPRVFPLLVLPFVIIIFRRKRRVAAT